MTRIVLVVQSFPKLSETFIFRKVAGLLERGWDVHVVCNTSHREEWAHFGGILESGARDGSGVAPTFPARRSGSEGGRSGKEKDPQYQYTVEASAPSLSRERETLPALKLRVSTSWPHRPHWIAGMLLPLVLLECLVRNPAGTWRYLGSGWRMFGTGILKKLYTDRPIICLKPDVLHFEFGALAVGRMYLKELLGSRIVVSFRGYDLNFSGLEIPARTFYPSGEKGVETPAVKNGIYLNPRPEGRGNAHALVTNPKASSHDLQIGDRQEGFSPFDHRGHSAFYSDVWEKADVIHLLGKDLWQRAQARGCPPAKRHVLIPPAIDTGLYNPGDRRHQGVAGTADRPVRILSVGRLEWKKGYEYAMRAVRRLVDKGLCVEYHIVGDGAYLEALTFARYDMGLGEVVHFTGALSPNIVREKMIWADLLVHAAVTEGFCNAVMEAQAMMLPVVSTDAGGLPENVADGESGFVVDRRNPDALAEKIEILARDAELRQRMGAAGRERVRRCFRIENQITAFEEMYRNVGRLAGANLRSTHSPLWVGMQVSERGSRRPAPPK